jgi:multidrug resistance efflux pump
MKLVNSNFQFRYNILYWFIFPGLIIGCYYLTKFIISDRHEEFYGYTDNKETQLSIDLSSYVEKIHVVSGQQVKKGDLLITLSKSMIDKDISDIELI